MLLLFIFTIVYKSNKTEIKNPIAEEKDEDEAEKNNISDIQSRLSNNTKNTKATRKLKKRTTIMFKEHYDPETFNIPPTEQELKHYEEIRNQNDIYEEEVNKNPYKLGIYYKDNRVYDINKNFASIKVKEKHFPIIKENLERNELMADVIIYNHTTRKVRKIKDKKKRSHSFDDYRNLKRIDFYDRVKDFELAKTEFYDDKVSLELYYTSLFKLIEDELDNQLDEFYRSADSKDILTKNEHNMLMTDLELERNLILAKTTEETIPLFNTVDALHLGRGDLDTFDSIWKDFESKMVEKNLKITFNVKVVDIDLHLLLHKIFNPPVIGCIVGLFVGMSGLRDVFFSNNHYIKNCYYICTMASKAFVPLLFLNVGNSLMKAPKFNLSFSLTYFQVILSFALTFVIIPFLGMAMIKFWQAIYGGIIDDSKAFRFAMFISSALPTSPNFIIVLSILDGFYLEEYSYINNRQTLDRKSVV